MRKWWKIGINVFCALSVFLLMASFFFYIGAKTAEKEIGAENETLRKMYTDLRKELLALKGDRP